MNNSTEPDLGTPIRLHIPNELYDDWIHSDYPDFQKKNRFSPNTPVIIDFSGCEWVSPLPLLALVVEIMSYSVSGRHIDINLGEGASTDEGAPNRSRTRKFLSVHGFLSIFASRNDLSIQFQFDKTAEYGDDGRWYDAKTELQTLRELIEKSSESLFYGNSIVLPATAWALPYRDDQNLSGHIREQVQRLLRKADTALFKFKTEARKYRDVTLQRLNQVLLELVENTAEYAYSDTLNGHVGLYIRVRQTDNMDASKARRKELAISPLLSTLLLNEKQHQIEVFVLDVGRGLFADIDSWGEYEELKKLSSSKLSQPLRTTASLLFVHPLSSHDRMDISIAKERGSSTGLMHLNSILSHQNDSTRITTGHEWLAGKHPRTSGFYKNQATSGGYKSYEKSIKGTFFHVGISFAEIPELDFVHWFVSDKPESYKTRLSVINKFSKSTKPSKNQVIDIRRGEGLENVQAEVKKKASTATGTVIRVNRIAEKNLVNSMVNSWVEGIGEFQQKKPLFLYLCDLGRFQAIDIVWVVKSLFNGKERIPLKNVPIEASIFLVTEDLCCIELKVWFTPHPHPSGNDQYLIKVDEAKGDIKFLANRLVYVLYALRHCDTDRLWNRIDHLNEEWPTNPVLINDVQWGVGGSQVLPHYLNFSVLVQDQEAARYVRRALRRILALFPDANDHALDGLVGSTLHDAKKWLIRPKKETEKQVLIGSLSVTGSTLNRYKPNPNVVPVGVIDCIKTPYFEPISSPERPHLAALLWDHNRSSRTTANPPRYRRLGKSAFVESINNGFSFCKTIHDEKLYKELETNNLVKLGHWCYGDRHSLLELNAELAIEQSGAIPWLAKQITDLCQENSIVLAFPVDKLAYRLAHHVKLRVKGKLTLLPLSFLPRFAGGMTQLAPLVLDSAKKLSESPGEKQPLAIFLDFGFITNRTLRHVVRQLYGVGFKKIDAMGLLNRSSAPAFSLEKNYASPFPVPNTYWTWNVPILGTGAHCPLCSSLSALARLRRLADEAHVDLLERLEKIGETWRARDVSDFWEESGLPTLPLNDELKQKIALLFDEVVFENLPVTSSTLSSLVIEFLRATGNINLPLDIAKILLSVGGSEHAVELIATVLMLVGGGFSASDLHDYVALLAESAIDLGTREYELEEDAFERRARLLGLVSLVFATQSSVCKLAVKEQLCQQLESKDINNATDLRIALIALTTDSDESRVIQDAFSIRCRMDSNKTQLIRNYHAIRPEKGTARDSWDKLTQVFGRSKSHSQQSLLGNLLAELNKGTNPLKVLTQIERLASLLGQCDQRFVDKCLGVDLRKVIVKTLDLLTKAQKSSITAANFRVDIEQTFGQISTQLHSVLMRFGDRAESNLIYMLFYDMLQQQAKNYKLAFMKDVVITNNALAVTWPKEISGYLPICGYISLLISEIFSNIAGKSISALPPSGDLQFADLTEKAEAWLWFDTTNEEFTQGITLVIVTGLNPDKPDPLKYKPTIPGLYDCGIRVESKVITSGIDRYFEVRVRIPSLSNILEEP